MNEEIEKLKRERDAAIEAGLKLADMTESLSGSDWTDFEDLVNKLKALRPTPERLRGWANVYRDGGGMALFQNHDSAKSYGERALAERIAVPMIEAKPLPELPEMEEWESVGDEVIERDHREHIAYALDPRMALKISDAHNAAIRAFKAWAEAAKKEVGDE